MKQFILRLDCSPMPPRYFDGRFSSGALWNGELEPSTIANREGAYALGNEARAKQLAVRLEQYFGGEWSIEELPR